MVCSLVGALRRSSVRVGVGVSSLRIYKLAVHVSKVKYLMEQPNK